VDWRTAPVSEPSSAVERAVNIARGAVIDKRALWGALRKGIIAGAALDVIEDEPLKSPEEAQAPNLIATCHSAFCSRESRIEMRSASARIALGAIQGWADRERGQRSGSLPVMRR